MLAVNLIDGSLGVFNWSRMPTGGGFIKLHASLRLVHIVGVSAEQTENRICAIFQIHLFQVMNSLLIVFLSWICLISSIVMSGTLHSVTYPSESPLSRNRCDLPFRDVVMIFIAGGQDSGWKQILAFQLHSKCKEWKSHLDIARGGWCRSIVWYLHDRRNAVIRSITLADLWLAMASEILCYPVCNCKW